MGDAALDQDQTLAQADQRVAVVVLAGDLDRVHELQLTVTLLLRGNNCPWDTSAGQRGSSSRPPRRARR